MARSKRLSTVVQLAELAKQNAASDFANSRLDVETYESKLTELRACRAEYQDELLREGTLTGGRIQQLHTFIVKLDEVIAELEKLLMGKRMTHEQHRATWMGEHLHTKALTGVVDRYRAEEQRAADRVTQRELDDRPKQK